MKKETEENTKNKNNNNNINNSGSRSNNNNNNNAKQGFRVDESFSSNIYIDNNVDGVDAYANLDLYWFVGFTLIMYTIAVLSFLKLKQRYCKRSFSFKVV